MTKRLLVALVALAVAVPMVGCGSKEDSYDPNNIAVKQPGDGPPPINSPMSEGKGGNR